MKKILSTLFLILFAAVLLFFGRSSLILPAFGQVPEEIYADLPVLRDRFESPNGLSLPYSLYFPKDYDSEASYPLLLYLHEAGARGADNRVQTDCVGFLDAYLSGGYADSHPCFLLIPQCAQENQWVDVPWETGCYSTKELPPSESLSAVLSLVEGFAEQPQIDASRLYVLGLSMGGYGTWDIIARNPELFAAAVPVCGGADPSAAGRLVHMPIWTFHGSEDPIVPCWGTSDMAKALTDAGSDAVRFTEYPGEGHTIEPLAFYEPELFPWLFRQAKP